MFKFSPLALAVSTVMFAPAISLADQPEKTLDTVVVTAEAMDAPLKVDTDPHAPRQPVPTHDGADYLKTIPGFAVTRKGGSDGDPVLRGMAGSRLGVMVDGENLLGGCNYRMDAPTAYIYPELYDKLTVIKGPQTVTHGPVNVAGTVMFEREIGAFDKAGYRLHASALEASASRHDVLADIQAGNQQGYVQFSGADSEAGDYKDGNGDKVHSHYHRYGGQAALGWTPDRDTRIEANVQQSDGEAAYADRGMDGTKFLRESQNIHAQKRNINDLVKSVDVHVYQNSVDHIMDDQALRTPGMMGYANLSRDTEGARLASDLAVSTADMLTVGMDTQHNSHASRNAGVDHVYSAWSDDAVFRQTGVFAELEHSVDAHDRLITGYRADKWQATDQRSMIMTGMMPPKMSMNPTADEHRNETLQSGFVRMERDLADAPATLYAGLGQAERFPDYWESIAKQGDGSISAFDTHPETTRQLDVGALYKDKRFEGSAALFYGKTADFILIDYTSMMVSNGYTRNIDATTWGGEMTGAYRLTQDWRIDSSIAYVRGSNDTDDTALAQLPPLEGRLGLNWSHEDWSVGGLLRAVERQTHYDLGRGTIVGKDLEPGAGFTVFSVNAGWKPRKDTLLSAGIDNLFNKTYAEFVSRAGGNGMGGAIPGYVQTDRVNEPGRTVWAKIQFDL